MIVFPMVVWAEIARRRSLTPQLARQGNRRLRRLAQDARALMGESA